MAGDHGSELPFYVEVVALTSSIVMSLPLLLSLIRRCHILWIEVDLAGLVLLSCVGWKRGPPCHDFDAEGMEGCVDTISGVVFALPIISKRVLMYYVGELGHGGTQRCGLVGGAEPQACFS